MKVMEKRVLLIAQSLGEKQQYGLEDLVNKEESELYHEAVKTLKDIGAIRGYASTVIGGAYKHFSIRGITPFGYELLK